MEITSGVHVVDLGIVQAYLFCEADRVTLIDAGLATSANAILGSLEAAGRKPTDLRQILVTHHHGDHTGALAELVERTGAHVISHAADAPVVRGVIEGSPPILLDVERAYFESKPHVPPAPASRVDREVNDGDEIDLEGRSTIVGVPGHTAGSVALYVPRRRILFTGDAVASVAGKPIVGVFNVDSREARASFAKLAELDFDVACFGHGAPLGKNASLAFRRLAGELAASPPG